MIILPNLRTGLAALATLAVPALMLAQVSLYEFSQTTEAYTEITEANGGYSLGSPTYWPPVYNMRAFVDPNNLDGVIADGYLNGAYGPGFPIGFDFTFNGDVFDRVGISNSGWISFGKSSDGNQAVWVYGIGHPHGRPFVQSIGGPNQAYKRNRVAGWGSGGLWMQDMSPLVPPGPISALRIATIGTSPNRVCVIQFSDLLQAYPPSASRINFQIRLNESDNSVDVRYGEIIVSYSASNVQVGLGGRVPEDFNSRMTVYEQPAFLYDWNTTVRGLENTDACYATEALPFQPNGSGVAPVVGLNFKWSPSSCPPPVWPLTITDIGFDAAGAIWEPTAAGEYEYYVSTENSITGPEISSGTTNDPEAFFFGLEPSTTYYVFVRSICAGELGTWSLATVFDTKGGGMVECDGTAMTENYCSAQFSVKDWLYISGDGSPLRIEFLGGFVGNAGTESFKVWTGTEPVGPAAFTGAGDVTGNAVESSSALFIRLITDAGACEAQPWYLPYEWRVGCKNCTDPLATFSVVEDCDNMEYSVAVNIFNLGSSTSVSLENPLGVAPTTVSSTGVHMAGPFPAGQSVIVTVQNPDNVMCYTSSAPQINAPCVLQGCGPTVYTYCYSDNESRQWAYQGTVGQEIGVRFIRGSLGLGDQLRTYNGLNIDDLTPTVSGWGTLANKLITSGAPSTDRAVVMDLQSDASMSCMNEDPLYGSSEEWEYVVACYDGCTQPKATFTTECLNATQFNILVTLSDIGSGNSVSITNNGSAPVVSANALGTYTVGPFLNDVPVTVEVEGTSILCTWTSSVLTANCINIGIDEEDSARLRVFPNPSNGSFRVELPEGISGSVQMQVLDVAGRLVGSQSVNASSSVTLDLEYLPTGLYTLVVQGATQRTATTISIQH